MRAAPPPLVAALILLVTSGAAAQPATRKPKLKYPKGIHWLGDVKAALREAVERHAPLLVAFIQEGEKLCDLTVAGQHHDKKTIQLSRRFVCLVANRGNHELVKGRGPDGRIKKVCSKFGCVTCVEHQKVDLWAFQKFNVNGMVQTPWHILCDPKGNVIERFKHHLNIPNEELIRAMEHALEVVGPGLDRLTFRKLSEELRRADGYLHKQEVRRAVKQLRRIRKLAGRSTVGERAGAMLKQVEAMAVAALKKIDTLIAAGEYRQAREEAARGKTVFRDLRTTARLFDDRLKLLRGKGGSQAARASQLLVRAEALFKARRYAGAEALYRQIVERYGTTAAARQARLRLRAFERDPALKKALAEARMASQCTKWMKMGDLLLETGRKKQAAEYYRKIIDAYPGTRWAEAARKKLGSSA